MEEGAIMAALNGGILGSIFEWTVGIVVTLLAWFGVRTVRRIDALEKEKADKAQINSILRAIEKISDSNNTDHAKINDMLFVLANKAGPK